MSELVDRLVASITKAYGKGSAMFLGSLPDSDTSDWVSSGSAAIDNAIGRPGFPCGKLSSINGYPGAGKTTIVTHVLAECQKRGGVAMLLDTEYSFDPERAARIGVDSDKLILCQPPCMEEAFGIIDISLDELIKEDRLGVIAWDTVSVTLTKAQIELPRDAQATQAVATQARCVSFHLGKIVRKLAKSRCALIFVNQLKQNVGVTWGSGDAYIAERPIGYHSHVILRIHKKSNLQKSGEVYGITSGIRVVKNKVAPPFKKCEVDIVFTDGIDDSRSLIEAGVSAGLIRALGGGWYELHLEGQEGFRMRRSELLEWLKNDEAKEEIRKGVREYVEDPSRT